MTRWVFIFIVFFMVVLTTTVIATDLTPYKFMMAGNSYSGARNTSITFMADRYDCVIAGMGDWPGMHDSIWDTANAGGHTVLMGPYASSNEIVLDFISSNTETFAERMVDTTNNWFYIYAIHYLDSIGVDPESLVVHIADDSVNITQNEGVDNTRGYALGGLNYIETRFAYQNWKNVSGDTALYPSGYQWMPNGANTDAARAIAYAFRRYLMEDSSHATRGTGGGHRWTAIFMDNQYRGGQAPRLYSYYTINGTNGGPTSGLDWVEQAGMEVSDSCTVSYDASTLRIDSTINAVLDAQGLGPTLTFANIEKFSAIHLGAVVPFVNAVSLEHPLDWEKNWSTWAQWYDMADTMANHPEVYIDWSMHTPYLCGAPFVSDSSDSNRIYHFSYSFFLQMRDTNAYMLPGWFNDSTWWRDIYHVDLQEPDGAAYEVSSTGSGGTLLKVMRRNYNSGNDIVILRTCYNGAGYQTDSVLVSLGGTFSGIDANADTSAGVTSIYLLPYESWIGTTAGASSDQRLRRIRK
jgi:hypothetical protein